MIQPWKTDRSETIGNFRIFKLRNDHKISPRTGKPHDFFVMDCPGWVNVIALTPDHKLILVEQFRHGTESVDLEIPGGVMDPTDASPEITGMRELREETGYAGDSCQLIGSVAANPAIMNNTCYTVLIKNCHRLHETEFDHSEDIETHVLPIDEVLSLATSGVIKHSLVIAALFHFQAWRAKNA